MTPQRSFVGLFLRAALWVGLRAGQLVAALWLIEMGAPLLLKEKSPDTLLREGLLEDFKAEATPVRLENEMDRALSTGDIDDALLLRDAAALAGVALPQRQLDQLAAETTTLASLGRGVADCGKGAITGSPDGAAGLACAIASDFTVIGDIRDLARELPKDDPNDLVLGLSAVGLALEAGTLITLGGAAPAKGAVSAAKAAARAGWIAGPLAREMRVAVNEAVDVGRLRRMDIPSSADEVVQARGLARLTEPLGNLKTVYDSGGRSAVKQALRASETMEDLAGGARAARVLKSDSAPVMRILGQKAMKGVKIIARGSWRILVAVISVVFGLFQGLLFLRSVLRGTLDGLWIVLRTLWRLAFP